MVILGTPAISFGLSTLEWLVIVGVAVILIYGNIFIRYKKRRADTERENKELAKVISESTSKHHSERIAAITAEFNHLELLFRVKFKADPEPHDLETLNMIKEDVMNAFPWAEKCSSDFFVSAGETEDANKQYDTWIPVS